MRDQPLAAYGRGKSAAGLAHSLLTWSGDVVLCTDGGRTPPSNGIRVIATRIARLEGKGDVLERIVFTDGDVLPRRAIFFNTGQDQHCDLPEKFGCVFTSKRVVRTDRFGATNIPGLYVAGDASRDVQFVIVAAAEGAKAAVAINTSLQLEKVGPRREDFR
jgi:thioredoxin reductase